MAQEISSIINSQLLSLSLCLSLSLSLAKPPIGWYFEKKGMYSCSINIALLVSTFVTQICIHIYKGPINVALVCACVDYIFFCVRPLHVNNLLEVRAP